jgi:hypothetical protein
VGCSGVSEKRGEMVTLSKRRGPVGGEREKGAVAIFSLSWACLYFLISFSEVDSAIRSAALFLSEQAQFRSQLTVD